MEACEYERTAAAEEHHWWFHELRTIWNGLLSHAMQERPLEGRFLDAGCGTGANLRALEKTRRAIGLDLSSLALAFARERTSSPLVGASVLALPFAEGIFDVVLCTDVLYHKGVSDDVAALREMRRILRPGGWVIVNVPAFDSLRSAHDRAMHTARRYRKAQLRRRLLEAGLCPTRLLYWNGLLFAGAALLRLLRRNRGMRSEIVALPAPLHGLLRTIARLDATLALGGLIPAGLSVAALAQREG